MRTNPTLAISAASLLLGVQPAGALSPETTCENIKLRAAGAYARCLARAATEANAVGGEPFAPAIMRCDARFDRAFERAEADGACRTAGGPATLRGPIRGQMEDTLATATTGPGCPSTPAFDQDTSTYTCTLKSGSAIDLAAIVTQIGSDEVTDDRSSGSKPGVRMAGPATPATAAPEGAAATPRSPPRSTTCSSSSGSPSSTITSE